MGSSSSSARSKQAFDAATIQQTQLSKNPRLSMEFSGYEGMEMPELAESRPKKAVHVKKSAKVVLPALETIETGEARH